jgi:hypothetical protein
VKRSRVRKWSIFTYRHRITGGYVRSLAQREIVGFNPITQSNRIIGTAFLIVVGVTVVATRGIAVLLPLLALVTVLFALYERTALRIFTRAAPVTAAFGILLAYALLSTSWGVSPQDSIPHVSIAITLLASAHAISAWIGEQQEPRLRHIVFWTTVAFGVGLMWLTFDVLAEQAIKRWFVNGFDFLRPQVENKHYRFDQNGYVWLTLSDLNRNIAAVNLLLWPVLMCATLLWSGSKKTIIMAALFAAAGACTFVSSHETSKLAFIVASLVFLLAHLSVRAVKGLLIAGWVATIIGTIPIALYAYSGLQLHEANWVQSSGRDRIVIWADIAERALERPLLGVGARTTNELNDLGTVSLKQPEAERTRKIGRHPHNVYLQAWYELGGVGAILLGVAGLIALTQVLKFPAFTVPFSLAMLTSMSIELALCWDIWQRWFFALICFSAVMLVLALRWGTLSMSRGASARGSV